MRLHLFDDARADAWSPFALSRPVSELRFGALLLRERIERWAGRRADGLLTRPWLADFTEPAAPPVTGRDALPEGEDRLLVSSRWVPPLEATFVPPEEDRPCLLVMDGTAVGCWLPAGTEPPGEGWTAEPRDLPDAGRLEVEGRVLSEVWDLVADGAERTGRDTPRLAPSGALTSRTELAEGVHVVGQGEIYLEESVRLEPGVVLDVREGPVWLGAGVEVLAGARLGGPLYAARGSRLLGGPLEALTAGPVSYLRGEISETTTLGWVNKAHAGHLGHAYLGRWVNLGAGTTNSDLKNNYGPVRLAGPDGDRETGLLKLGCLLGDHVKTAIGTLLGTGAAVGAGASVFGDVRPPRWVPPFTWGAAPGSPRYRREDFVETAAVVMGRRDVELGPDGEAWLRAVWDEAAGRGSGEGA